MPPKKNNPPKKQKTRDIASFFCTPDKTVSSRLTESTQPGGATSGAKSGAAGSNPGGGAKFSQPSKDAGSNLGGATGSQTRSQTRVKEENGVDIMGEHLHRITVKFSTTGTTKYTIDCDHPRTVLEVIKSTENFEKKVQNCPDENIVIQLGKARDSIVATHFPCTCIRSCQSLIISGEPEKVEVAQDQFYKPIQSRDKYSVFYIDTVGGKYTKQKKLFRNNAVKEFKYLCVYGEKGMTVKECLKRDGRFIDDLDNFTLSDNADPDSITECTQKVDNLHEKQFKICLPRNNKRASSERQQENSGASNNSLQKCDTTPVVDVVQQRGISVRAAVEKSGSSVDIEEIYEKLRQQTPALRELMESRFPDHSYQEALNLRKENFGKIQQSFSEVHRVRKLLKLGESVCKVVVKNVCQGTGFVLFDNFILTNAHLFKGCIEGQKLKEGIDVYFLFNYENPEPHINYYYFELAQGDICYTESDLDYAILELNPESQKSNHSTQTKKMKVPPGLLKIFGLMPRDGEACIIGHPAGGLKKMDPTFIIEKEKREQAVRDHLHPYKDSIVTLLSISHLLKDQGIENIMMGGKKADKEGTYNTFMYHGSSGSPVFDAHGRVFGLHTAGYAYGFPNQRESVIEFAQPLLTIFKHFVSMLKVSGQDELLARVNKEVKGNSDLEKVFKSVVEPKESRQRLEDEPADPDELLDYIESMDIH
ncbi:LOW QUALITY PROTEIN: protein FAM111A-like [Sander lucioperca]|uniref:LOW QUALITY PROTEIN: protein FAM111A-like n=1 Tax=Sander lucioperca TaxID=283035 RepID=UPI001653D2EA|nr:LOW QUALITY PROTEIN: protein FAM111A-like [Sander lucioperca]